MFEQPKSGQSLILPLQVVVQASELFIVTFDSTKLIGSGRKGRLKS